MKNRFKLFLASALALGANLSDACQLTVLNNTQSTVQLYGVEGDDCAKLAPGDEQNFGDPEDRAYFNLVIDGDAYQVRQIACSDTHEIYITVGQVLTNTLNSKLFVINEDGKPEMPKSRYICMKYPRN